MLSAKRLTWAVCGALTLAVSVGGSATAADDLYAPPGVAKLKAATLKWMAAQKGTSPAVKKQVEAVWADADGDTSSRALFAKVIETFALVNGDAKKLVESCTLQNAPLVAPGANSLNAKGNAPFFTTNMRVFYGRYLTQRKMYDEGLRVLKSVDPKTVADPATHLFFTSVCQHQLLMQKEGLATLAKLLKNTKSVPVSYTSVAGLMQYDLQQFRDKSLKTISLKMRDSERRLDLARGGQRVQQVQGEIIADLDELIEKLESAGGS
jgi:hypothetical protein